MTRAVEHTERLRGEPSFTPSTNTLLRAGLVAAALALGWQPVLAAPVEALPSVDTLPPGAQPGGAQPQLPTPPPSEPDPEIFPIPPMIERPLGVDEGPKVQVREFRLAGVTEHPEQGITKAALLAILERQRQARPEGFTIGQLQVAANDITQYYREAGFILAQAFVPQQQVDGGVVTIEVMEGRLGQVLPEGNARYSDKVLQRPFADISGTAVRKETVESALLQLTDYPGLGVFGVFRPGKEVGTTDLALKVQKEQPYGVSVSADNHGTEFTGEYRARVDFQWNNPTGMADRLALNVLQTIDPANGTYGAINYEIPLVDVRYTLGAGYSHNAFEVGQELKELSIEGDTDIANAYLKYDFVRSRTKNLNGKLDFSYKKATVQQLGADLGEDILSVLTAEFGFDGIDRFAGINQGAVLYSHGFPDLFGSLPSEGGELSSRVGASGERAGGDFDKLTLRYSRLQSLTKNHSLLLRLDGQFSDDLLVSLEQLPLGGPYSVRAYPVAEALVDKGGAVTVEWIMNAPGFADKPAFANRTWGEIFQVSVFFDYAGGERNDPLGNEFETVDLSGAGLGLQMVLPGKFLGRLDVATPISDEEPSNDRDPQYYFNLNYKF